MKTPLVFALLGAVALVAAQLEEAETCNPEACKLPDCRCSSTDIPGGFAPRDTPQFVTITFDDAITAAALPNYQEILFNRRNFNGCPIGATFFVSHEWTDYSVVNQLYNNGFEIALNSISHQTPSSYWMEATYDIIKEEIADQRQQIARFANIPAASVFGVRLPFLQLSGNTSYQVMKDHSFSYDSSWPTISFTNPALWPYTLDYSSNQDCPIEPCPTASIPGVWVMPMVSWLDLANFPCAMADACSITPDLEDENAWYNFILQNFERHYLGNRAPFPFYIHEGYLRAWPAVMRAMIRFINLATRLPDVYIVNKSEVLDWVKNPIPMEQYKNKQCRVWLSTACSTSLCPLTAAHNNWNYYMTVCGACPRVYPWVGNPLGA